MIKQTIPIVNKLGLHARASGKLLETALRFTSNVQVSYNGQTADARNIMALLLLGAPCGREVEVTASGKDEIEAIEAIQALFAGRFGEGE